MVPMLRTVVEQADGTFSLTQWMWSAEVVSMVVEGCFMRKMYQIPAGLQRRK
jgi:hypothetical protein